MPIAVAQDAASRRGRAYLAPFRSSMADWSVDAGAGVCVCSVSPLGHKALQTGSVSDYTVPRGATHRWSRGRTSAAIAKSAS